MEIRLKASKTDPFRKGISIFVGRTNNDLCPIAMLAYTARRGGDQGPLFRWSDGQPLTRSHFVTALREALAMCGFDQSKYCGHSFRIGAATTAALQGISDSTIKVLGRWESSAYQLYVRTPRQMLGGISATLSNTVPQPSH